MKNVKSHNINSVKLLQSRFTMDIISIGILNDISEERSEDFDQGDADAADEEGSGEADAEGFETEVFEVG
jgi:hypothetical protein